MPTDRSLNRVKKISRSRFGQQTLHIAKEEISLLKTGPPARKSSVDFTKSAFLSIFSTLSRIWTWFGSTSNRVPLLPVDKLVNDRLRMAAACSVGLSQRAEQNRTQKQ